MPSDLNTLEDAFRRDPSSDEAYAALREAYLAEERHEDLARALERRAERLDQVTSAVNLFWEAAQAHREAGDAAAEIRVLFKALEVDRSHEKAGDRLATLLEAAERWGDLVHLVEQRAEQLWVAGSEDANPGKVAALEHRAGQIWEDYLGRADEALACYRRAFEADGANLAALAAGRRIYASLGLWDGAASLLAVEIEATSDPADRAGLMCQLGELQWRRQGRMEEAARTVSDALELAPSSAAIQEALGELLSSADYPGSDGLARASAIFLDLAVRRQDEGESEQSVAYLKRALGADPTSEQAFTLLQQAYQQLERWEELERLYAQRTAVVGPQEAASLQMYRADLLLRHLGRVDEARRCFEAALPHQGPAGDAAAQLLEIYREGNDWDLVIRILRAQVDVCTTLEAKVGLKLEMSAILSDRLDDPEAAAHLVHEVLQLQPDSHLAMEAYQAYFRRKGDFPNLVNLQRYLADQGRVTAMPSMDICDLLEEVANTSERRLGDLEGAVEAWQQIAEIHPDTARSQEALDRLAARMHSWQQKVQALDREVAEAVSQAQRIQALRRLAKVHFEWQVEPERTREILQEILDLSPGDEHALRMRVDICERDADFAGLAQALEAQLDGMMTKAERISILRRLGDLRAQKLGNMGGALAAYQALLELNPGDYRVQERVLRLLEEAEDLEGLVRFLERRAQTSRSMARRVEALARLAKVAGGELSDHARAIRAHEQILTLDPDNRESLEALSSNYRKAGRLHDLLALLRRRLALLPEQPVAPRAQLLLEMAQLAEQRLDLPGDAVEAYRQRAALLPADGTTRDALLRLLGSLGRHREMVEVLNQQLLLAEEAEDRVALIFRMVDLLEEKLGEPSEAAALLERLLLEDAPADLDAHRRLRQIHLAAGNPMRACELAERELTLAGGEPAELLNQALELARRWAEIPGQQERAAAAYERALEQDPEHLEAMQGLLSLLRSIGAHQRLVRLGQTLFLHLVDPEQQIALLTELGQVHEEHLQDPEGAFAWFRRAHELFPGVGGAYGELERLAQEYGLWEDLILLLLEQRQAEQRPERFLTITFRVAEICQSELKDPDAAFEELVQGLSVDPSGQEVLPRLESLALTPGTQRRLLEVYRQAATVEDDPVHRQELLRKEARLAEEELDDPARALAALAALAHSDPDLEWIPEEAERLAELAGRWDEVLEIQCARLDRVESSERVSLLWRIAGIQEEQAGLARQAFRTYLRALALAPEEEITEEHLWRLARQLDGGVSTGEDEGVPAMEVAPAGQGSRDDATQEVRLEDIASDDAALEVLASDDIALEMLTSAEVEELDGQGGDTLGDEEGETLELGEADVLSAQAEGGAPPLPSALAADPWAEFAEAYRDLPAESPARRTQWLLAEAKVWQEGAGKADRAVEVLAEAAAIDPEQPEVVEALETLCQAQGRQDELIRIYADAVERATEAGQLLRLELKVAHLLLAASRPGEAEKHLLDALELDPACSDAEACLTDVLEQQGRLADLGALQARQLRSLEGDLDPESRERRLLELANLYQTRLEQPEDAVRYLASLAALPGVDRTLQLRLANLYQQLGEWPELVQILEQISQRSLDEDDLAGALAALHRLARVQRDELELDDRAMEAYQRLLTLEPSDAAALTCLAELYEAHEQRDELLALLRGWIDLTGEDASAARPLLLRLARLEAEHDPEVALAHLQRARAMGDPDSELDEELTGMLLRGGHGQDAAELLQDRLSAARQQGAQASVEARLLLQLAEVQDTGLGQSEQAWESLSEALELCPDEVEVLQAAAQYHWRHEAWSAYADSLERIIDAAPGEVDVDDSLMVAGHVLENSAGDPARARQLYQQVLDRSPSHLPALEALIRLCGKSEGDRAEALLRRKEALVDDPRARAEILVALADVRLGRGAPVAEAEELYQGALELCDDLPGAVDGLSRLLVDQDRLDGARLLLEDALTRLSGGTASGLLGMRLGEVYQRLGRHAEAYTFLLEAHRKDKEDPLLRIAVGLNRYHLERWREAVDFLEPLLEQDHAALPRDDLAGALFAGGRAALELGRSGPARAFLDAAVVADPEQEQALTELASMALEEEEWERGEGVLKRLLQLTNDDSRRRELLRMLGDLRVDRFSDPAGAAEYFEELHTRLGDDDAGRLELLPMILPALQAAGRHAGAAKVAEELAALLDEPRQSSALLLTAARARAAAGQDDLAATRWREVLDLDPSNGEAVEGLARRLLDDKEFEEAAQLAGGFVTGRPPAPTRKGQARRGRLLELLARAFMGQGMLEPAVAALEEALATGGEDLDLRLELASLYDELPAPDPDAALNNHRQVLALDGAHADSLRALAAAAMGGRELQQAHALYQALDLLGELDAGGEAFLSGFCLPELNPERPYQGQLIEDDRGSLYNEGQAPAIDELLGLLWGQAKTLFPRDPADLGLAEEDKVPAMDARPEAMALSAAARALGRPGAQLFMVDPHHPLCAPAPRVVAMAVPAVVISSVGLAGRSTAELLFLLGRAVELSGPPGVLAAGLEQEQFVHLMLRVLRAFHPRHLRGRKDLGADALEEVSLFRRALPFKTARRLGDLFRELGNWPFDSRRWRRSVHHGANRAGLLLCGDLSLAAAVILKEEGLDELQGPEAVRQSPALRDLISFVASDAYPAFRKRLIAAT